MIHELIINTCKSEKTCNNSLTDGQFDYSYKEILSAFDKMDNYLDGYRLSTESCIAYYCSNSIFSAIFLLWLLCRKRRAILLSPIIIDNSIKNDNPLPVFCEYAVTVTHSNDKADLYSPETYVNISRNNNYIEKNAGSEKEGLVYLKTSGSMASPKMAVHSGKKLAGNVMNCVARFGLNYVDRVTIPIPIFHMYGLGAAFLPSVAAGASIDIQENTNLIKFLDRERNFNPDKAFLTPSLCEMFIQARKNVRLYKLVVTAGDRISQNNFVKFENSFGKLINLYGSTEMGAVATSDPDDSVDIRAKGFFKLLDGVNKNIKTADPDNKLNNGIGEIYFNHKFGFNGYVDLNGAPVPVESESDQWFPSKDLASITQDDRIKILGRCDNSVNRNGLLLPLLEVENAMERINGVNRVIVIAHGESKRGKRITAFCVPEKGSKFNSDELKQQCFAILPGYAIPDNFFVLKELPRLPNGKIDRQTLLSNLTITAERKV